MGEKPSGGRGQPRDRESQRAQEAVSVSRLLARASELGAIGRLRNGIHRLALTPQETQAKELVAGWLSEVGFTCALDGIGNLICLPPRPPALLTGSHLDTVPGGGAYDGALGLLVAVEAASAASDAGVEPRFAVVAWTGEEGTRFGRTLLGSSFCAGILRPEDFDRRDDDGVTLRRAMEILETRLPRTNGSVPFRSYLEIHMEQGSRLWRHDLPLGIVTSIVGITHLGIRVTGRSDHAGACDWPERRDALTGASEIALAVETLARLTEGEIMATVGRMTVDPGVQNVIPGKAALTVDIRSTSEPSRDMWTSRLNERLREICLRRSLSYELTAYDQVPSAALDLNIRRALALAVADVEVRPFEMVSRAGHDAQAIAGSGVPTGMLFVRSNGGSHNSEERVTDADMVLAAQALLAYLPRAPGGPALEPQAPDGDT